MPMVLLGIAMLVAVFFTQQGLLAPVQFLFTLHLPFWFSVAIGLLLTAWLLEG